ncbi:uridine phosphorylase [Pedobacter sp. UYP30]|uniref:nucleoside phosphorylase n=1 Tax=Pedobacter sp. UYP30 TaxID=1756400 RepID=UPI003395AF9E
MSIPESDLIINPDGSIYHLNLLPEDVADTIITVGDPDRVAEVSKHFDKIELKKGKREFMTHTGLLGSKRITVLSTGIGTDNIDIVLNELDALVNIDFHTREIKKSLKSLNIIRIGTSGAVQDDIPLGSIIASSFGLGMDALMNYYQSQNTIGEIDILVKINKHFNGFAKLNPYITAGSEHLLSTIGKNLTHGITVTAPGFYGPQGRKLRAHNSIDNLIERITSFNHNGTRITNLEMETAGIYALSNILGHQAISINAILASRTKLAFAKEPQKIIDKAIKLVLERSLIL